jgi:hypothetical protein
MSLKRNEILNLALKALQEPDMDNPVRVRAIKELQVALDKPSADYEAGFVDGLLAKKNKNSYHNIGKALVGEQKQ